MPDIHIVFDGNPLIATVNLLIVVFTIIVALQVINNFIGSDTAIFSRKAKAVKEPPRRSHKAKVDKGSSKAVNAILSKKVKKVKEPEVVEHEKKDDKAE